MDEKSLRSGFVLPLSVMFSPRSVCMWWKFVYTVQLRAVHSNSMTIKSQNVNFTYV